MVGTSWTIPTGYARPFVMTITSTDKALAYAKMLNLVDPHLCVTPAGWTPYRAEDVSADGIIVGRGSLNGASRAFAAVPQPASEY